jgi:hypothetical protein
MSRSSTVQRLQDIATRLRAARDPDAEPANASPVLRRLRAWQAARLGQTFADLREAPRHREAAAFFLSDLYGEQDVSWRDRDLARMMPTLVRWLPEAMLGTVCDALELDWLSHRLDLRVAIALGAEAGRAPPLRVASYAAAYRAAGSPEERARQIDLLMAVGRELDHIVRVPLVYGVLKLARGAAGRAGLGSLHNFLERGFSAFRAMGGADEFLRIIDQREREASRRLFAGDAAPFGEGFAEPRPGA